MFFFVVVVVVVGVVVVVVVVVAVSSPWVFIELAGLPSGILLHKPRKIIVFFLLVRLHFVMIHHQSGGLLRLEYKGNWKFTIIYHNLAVVYGRCRQTHHTWIWVRTIIISIFRWSLMHKKQQKTTSQFFPPPVRCRTVLPLVTWYGKSW